MLCPFCQISLRADAQECPACRLTFPRTSALVGAMPRISPVVADTTREINPQDHAKLKKRIAAIQRRFPQLVLQVVMHNFPEEHPLSMHVFWLFNAGNFAGDSKRGKDNHALLIALDPNRSEAAIIPGYGLEAFLKTETLDHLLELAGPAWQDSRWTDGFMRVLDGLDQLFESIAIPQQAAHTAPGEF